MIKPTIYFDMDETLLHSFVGEVEGLPSFVVDGWMRYSVSVRPDAKATLKEASRFGNVYVLTTAEPNYAMKALKHAGLLGRGSPIRKVYSTRKPKEVPAPTGPWVLIDNDPDSAAEKTQVLVGFNDFERIVLVPDYEGYVTERPDQLLGALLRALVVLQR